MIDIHTHVLPCMDDGSCSVTESIEMLRCIGREGITVVVATPHFYANRETIKEFLHRRNESARKLWMELNSRNEEALPQLLLGAEVAYYSGIGRSDELECLVIEGTKILLLELPFCKWDSEIIREIEEIQNKGRVQVMIAHIERYWEIGSNRRFMKQLLDMDVLIQVGLEGLIDWKLSHRIIKWGRQGYIDALGSDAHNMKERPPQWRRCIPIIEKYKMTLSIEALIKKY